MSIEQRLVDVLRRVDHYQPRQDLFARLERSLAADRAHRRRVRQAAAAAAAAAAGAAGWLWFAVSIAPGEDARIHAWTLELLETVVLVSAMLILAPLIRRVGTIFVTDVFRLHAITGDRFLRLLDVAYYLCFSGLIIVGADPTGLGDVVPLRRALSTSLERCAVFLGAMGVAHAMNLVLMPAVGLVFNASHRRARRRAAGSDAPATSPRAAAADRVSTWLVGGVVAVGAIGVLVLTGFVLGLGAD